MNRAIVNDVANRNRLMPINKFALVSMNTDPSEDISLQHLIVDELKQIIINMEVGAEANSTHATLRCQVTVATGQNR